jgi:hypothetical protein
MITIVRGKHAMGRVPRYSTPVWTLADEFLHTGICAERIGCRAHPDPYEEWIVLLEAFVQPQKGLIPIGERSIQEREEVGRNISFVGYPVQFFQ